MSKTIAKPKRKPLPPRGVQIAMRTRAEIKEAAEAAAEEEHRTLSQWIELLILAALKERERRAS